uniref:Uncharacterized protein n=1 Tax=Lepeophtheirus salmonis TaxID=72036 RepID=A0A0K2TR30_LEPSM
MILLNEWRLKFPFEMEAENFSLLGLDDSATNFDTPFIISLCFQVHAGLLDLTCFQ